MEEEAGETEQTRTESKEKEKKHIRRVREEYSRTCFLLHANYMIYLIA